MSFKNITVKTEYRSLIDNIVQEFYLPLLAEAKTYKRAVGFFSSSALIEISKGITRMVKNGGKIEIIASPRLSEEDIIAIEKGYQTRNEIIERALLKQIDNYNKDYYSKERLNLLANLIADGILDIKIAYTEDTTGIGMYHEKMGIIEDFDGNVVAFSGSMNESAIAMSINYETIDVFCSWKDYSEQERVLLKQNAFLSLWNNNEPNIKVLDFPLIKQTLIEKFKRSDSNYNIDKEEFKSSSLTTNVVERKKIYGARVPENIILHDYQEKAIESWVNENYRGIFDMATGTGKTYTGLAAIAKLSENLDDELAVIIVCPYQHLVEQWKNDIVLFNIDPIVGYSNSYQRDWRERLILAVRNQKLLPEKSFFCFICTNATFKSQFVQEQINKIKKPKLLVVDEAHNFGAFGYHELLDEKYNYRLALSATLERHHDEDGTALLYSFFGKKCIEYTLKQAIAEGKLTPYKYYPIMVSLTEDELNAYDKISLEMSKNIIKGKNGKTKLNQYGEFLAIKRARIVAGASMKLNALEEAIENYKDKHFLLIYCGATNMNITHYDLSSIEQDDIRQIDAVTNLLGNKLGMKVSKFTANESIEDRKRIIDSFKNGDNLQGIVAIKCLDEGVNIPSIQTAFILASTTNPKEYIQRRGRVLRKSDSTGKKYAEIYDFVTLPRNLEDVASLTKEQVRRDISLVKNELDRIVEFAKLSLNPMESVQLVGDICDSYNLPFIYDFDNEEEGL